MKIVNFIRRTNGLGWFGRPVKVPDVSILQMRLVGNTSICSLRRKNRRNKALPLSVATAANCIPTQSMSVSISVKLAGMRKMTTPIARRELFMTSSFDIVFFMPRVLIAIVPSPCHKSSAPTWLYTICLF